MFLRSGGRSLWESEEAAAASNSTSRFCPRDSVEDGWTTMIMTTLQIFRLRRFKQMNKPKMALRPGGSSQPIDTGESYYDNLKLENQWDDQRVVKNNRF
jgi:hypothetical protein